LDGSVRIGSLVAAGPCQDRSPPVPPASAAWVAGRGRRRPVGPDRARLWATAAPRSDAERRSPRTVRSTSPAPEIRRARARAILRVLARGEEQVDDRTPSGSDRGGHWRGGLLCHRGGAEAFRLRRPADSRLRAQLDRARGRDPTPRPTRHPTVGSRSSATFARHLVAGASTSRPNIGTGSCAVPRRCSSASYVTSARSATRVSSRRTWRRAMAARWPFRTFSRHAGSASSTARRVTGPSWNNTPSAS